MAESKISAEGAVKIARKVTWVGFWCNAVLGMAKILGGVLGRSGALIADGVHSFSDFASDILVLAMVGIARRKPDKNHEFGHGKYETLATVLLSLVLLAVSIGIFVEALDKIIAVAQGEVIPKPGAIALAICVVSIVVKEWLFQYTRAAGRRIHSEAVIANAWHHRSDAFSSIATLVGVGGAMFLGQHWRILDPIAALIVSIFIAIVSVRLAGPALSELLGKSLPEEDQGRICEVLKEAPGVITYHHLRTCRSGADVIIDLHLKVDGALTVDEAHQIATEVEHSIQALYPDVTAMVNTHIEPYQGQKIMEDGSCED
ncbi:MAG: cation diffusion facilitator family transporter [Bacteroidales bacterium]|nr:cation diffusion facilitator family transporter [Bacteroidales bacterium]